MEHFLILFKRILLIVLFIASGAQAMATVAMPYQMIKTNHVMASANDSMAVGTSDCESCMQHNMSDVDTNQLCNYECEGCQTACSLHFIKHIDIVASVFPTEKPYLNEDNHISSTTDSLFRPPIFC